MVREVAGIKWSERWLELCWSGQRDGWICAVVVREMAEIEKYERWLELSGPGNG